MAEKASDPCIALLSCLMFMGVSTGSMAFAADAEQTTFERVFGVPGTLEAPVLARVKALAPGEQLLIDRDGDGRNDEAWFIDTAARHQDSRRPVLVRVIDEDGDLDETGPDLDSDMYFADWQADGIIDTVTDYQDNDGDGDLDEMGSYFGVYQQPWTDKNRVKVWWSRDIGDDNLLWYDVDWSYHQGLCQYRSHFSGDEVFLQFELAGDSDEWMNVFEDPFAFYDPDGDGCSEVVMRICAVGHKVQSLRYSVDADDDAYGRRTHDYDFSITALPADGEIRTNDEICRPVTVRGIRTHPVLPWESAREFALNAPWDRVCLTWDEMNANTEGKVQQDPQERWEGIINHGSESFPQVGGPACSPLNKRNEIAFQPDSPLRLYYDRTDRRLHLRGATEGWLHVDYDLDGRADAIYTYADDDGDGVFDRRTIDVNGDGEIEFDWPMAGEHAREFHPEFGTLSLFYRSMLADSLNDSQKFIDAARSALGDAERDLDPVECFFLDELPSWMLESRLGERMRKTPAGARLYSDLIRDRLLVAMKQRFAEYDAWGSIERACALGDYATAADRIIAEWVPSGKVTDGRAFRSYTRRIAVEVLNAGGPQRDEWPIVLSVKDIGRVDNDFDPDECAVVGPDRWMDWRQIPHQVDCIDAAVGKELSFLADVRANVSVKYWLYYAPRENHDVSFISKTGTAEDWVPPNIGWESNRCAYRAYWGQFDFFGKKTEELIYADIGNSSYHSEVQWGMDALHVGKTSGLGGLTLYDGQQSWPVRNPAGEGNVVFSKHVLTEGPVRCAIEINAKNLGPDQAEASVTVQCVIYAEHQQTEVRARLSGGTESLVLAPGIVKLPREEFFALPNHGCFGTWGWQEDAIGDIGMGLIVAPDRVVDLVELADERRVLCRTSDGGQLRYWVVGDWRRGRAHPVAPTVVNWRNELRALADLLINDLSVELGRPEMLP